MPSSRSCIPDCDKKLPEREYPSKKGRISLKREDAKEPKSLGIIMKKLFSKQ
jgi:hypothetical protein